MTYKLPLAEDVHTSDLTAKCPRSVMHRRLGHLEPQYTTAIYRGQLAGVVADIICLEERWDDAELPDIIMEAHYQVEQMALKEHRPLSPSVAENLSDIHKDVLRNMSHFVHRLGHLFAKYEVIGCEVPCRFTLDMGDEPPAEFATHIDLLFKDGEGNMHLWDFKWVEQSPTMAFLGRNWQFMVMYLCVAYGSIRAHKTLDIWVQPQHMPNLSWVDLSNFKTYMRKTTTKDPAGHEVIFHKGDQRPLRNLIRTWTMDPDRETRMMNELRERVRMMRQGFWPRNPDALGCHLCESQQWCEPYHK